MFVDRECSGEMGWTGALSSSSNGKEVGVSVELAGFECRRVQVLAACNTDFTVHAIHPI